MKITNLQINALTDKIYNEIKAVKQSNLTIDKIKDVKDKQIAEYVALRNKETEFKTKADGVEKILEEKYNISVWRSDEIIDIQNKIKYKKINSFKLDKSDIKQSLILKTIHCKDIDKIIKDVKNEFLK